MKLAVIVTEYPKSTETFIYRDLVKFAELGAEVRLYHLTAFRKGQPLHAFAEPTRAWAQYIAFADARALSAFARAMTRPVALARVLATIVREHCRTPKLMLKSLALVRRRWRSRWMRGSGARPKSTPNSPGIPRPRHGSGGGWAACPIRSVAARTTFFGRSGCSVTSWARRRRCGRSARSGGRSCATGCREWRTATFTSSIRAST